MVISCHEPWIFYAYEFKVVQHLGPATPHGISINWNWILFALMYNRLGGGTRYDIQDKRSWSDICGLEIIPALFLSTCHFVNNEEGTL